MNAKMVFTDTAVVRRRNLAMGMSADAARLFKSKFTLSRTVPVVLAVIGVLLYLAATVEAGPIPRALRGKIITSPIDIRIPSHNFVHNLTKQDRSVIARDDDGKWTFYLVAFFNKPLPTDSLGVVVLDDRQEPVAVATVGGQRGQTTLACDLVVDSSETPGQAHQVNVYFVKDGKPRVLATKNLILK